MPHEKLTENRLTDARALRAIAHPVRISIMEQLALNGTMTASQLGDRIDETPANCSWHLRKLAEHGFVEEAGGGRGRERPWRATHMGMSWDNVDQPPETVLAGEALSQVLIEREVARFADSRAHLRSDSTEWQKAANSNLSMAWLTADELEGINLEVREIFARHFDRHVEPETRPEDARLCLFMQWGVPAYGLGGEGS